MVKKKAASTLTPAQKFYIEQHPDDSDQEIAKACGVSVTEIKKNRPARKKPKPKPETYVDNPRPGVYGMNAAASSRVDDLSTNGLITQDQIDRAAQSNNFELAAQLTKMRDRQQRDYQTEYKATHADRFHYLD